MDGRVVGYAVDHVAVLLRGELGGFQIVVFFVHGDPPLSFLMVFMAPLLAGLLLGFLPSGSFFEPGGNAKDTSNKIKAIFDARMKDGKRCSGSIPYGYNRLPSDKQTLVVDPVASEVVKHMSRRTPSTATCISWWNPSRSSLGRS